MSRIDPSLELVEALPPEFDEAPGESILSSVINEKVFLSILVTLLAVFIFIKSWLLFGWKWISNILIIGH